MPHRGCAMDYQYKQTDSITNTHTWKCLQERLWDSHITNIKPMTWSWVQSTHHYITIRIIYKQLNKNKMLSKLIITICKCSTVMCFLASVSVSVCLSVLSRLQLLTAFTRRSHFWQTGTSSKYLGRVHISRSRWRSRSREQKSCPRVVFELKSVWMP